MTEDASLDQFASSDSSETEDDESADSEPVGPGSTDSVPSEESAMQSEESDDSSDVEPAVSTFTWSPKGGECADCGASVERRWRSEGQRDGDLVCADCKEW